MKQWGTVWEEKIKEQGAIGVVFGSNTPKNTIELRVRKVFESIKKILPLDIREGSSVLDCGIGPLANFAIPLAKWGMDVSGVDISKTTLKYAKSYIEKNNVKIDLINDNLVSMENTKGQYDLVFCVGTFGHIPSYLALETLNQFYKKTKNGKYCLVKFWIYNKKSVYNILYDCVYSLAQKIKGKFKKTFFVNCSSYTHEEIHDMIKRSGFTFIKNIDGLYLMKKD